jgi:hypothetical protein
MCLIRGAVESIFHLFCGHWLLYPVREDVLRMSLGLVGVILLAAAAAIAFKADNGSLPREPREGAEEAGEVPPDMRFFRPRTLQLLPWPLTDGNSQNANFRRLFR